MTTQDHLSALSVQRPSAFDQPRGPFARVLVTTNSLDRKSSAPATRFAVLVRNCGDSQQPAINKGEADPVVGWHGRPDIRLSRFRAVTDRIRACSPLFASTSVLRRAYRFTLLICTYHPFAFAQPLLVSVQSKHASHALRWRGLASNTRSALQPYQPRQWQCQANASIRSR